ncbi:MAG: zf-HC2 domain-containing protein [candidate division Zixibacteria bacterium]|nr:zf-HC2 domain-containing protein [candidate division Zixibacteria bacterium]
MTDQHISDEQMQALLDGTAVEPAFLQAHLDACPRCRVAVEEYRHLFSALGTVPGPILAPEFADRVMARLPERPVLGVFARLRRTTVRDGMLVFAAFAAIAAATVVFIKPSLWVGLFQRWFSSSAPAKQHALTDAKGLLASLNINPQLLAAVVLTIVAISVIDWIITRRRRAHHPMVHLV